MNSSQMPQEYFFVHLTNVTALCCVVLPLGVDHLRTILGQATGHRESVGVAELLIAVPHPDQNSCTLNFLYCMSVSVRKDAF